MIENNNLRHWNALSKTDPKHTKPFQRAGGFRGTAIRPIFSTMMMTEHFGPCGIGWGMTKPEFTTVSSGDETLVYCTVGIWYADPAVAAKHRQPVYGVGGDKAVTKNKNGPVFDDEAFKKSYTDALSNAMKQIGVGADVHMGMFEDAKYVSDLKKEFDEDAPKPTPTRAPAAEPARAPPAESIDPVTGEVSPHQIPIGYIQTESGMDASDWRGWGISLIAAIKSAKSLDEVRVWQDANQTALATCSEQSPKVYKSICGAIDKKRTEFPAPAAAVKATDDKAAPW